ncbi:MAG: hypothetical protein GX894_06145 [Clostridia bacterium]|nr:hypothetical protein [Clostridia bacterium]
MVEATISKGVIATSSNKDNLAQTKSDWEEIAEWGNNLAKKNGLTKERSRQILQAVRESSDRNCRY